jgi:hypothetical protein
VDRVYANIIEYNQNMFKNEIDLPEWVNTRHILSPSWRELGKILEGIDRETACFEIGSGVGDILAILAGYGFKNIAGIEMDNRLSKLANQKLFDLYGIDGAVKTGKYPCTIMPKPELLIQLNCVYAETSESSSDYLKKLSDWQRYNGAPQTYLVELIDSSFTAPHEAYSDIVRVGYKDVQAAFSGYDVKRSSTFVYPNNSSSKFIYTIRKRD